MILFLLVSIIILVNLGGSNHESSQITPVRMAECIAEQAYTNPMDDKFKELVNAIAICEEGR